MPETGRSFCIIPAIAKLLRDGVRKLETRTGVRGVRAERRAGHDFRTRPILIAERAVGDLIALAIAEDIDANGANVLRGDGRAVHCFAFVVVTLLPKVESRAGRKHRGGRDKKTEC